MILEKLAFLKLDPTFAARFLLRLPKYFRQRRAFTRLAAARSREFPFASKYPMLFDAEAENGAAARGPYFWQDLLVAQRIFAANPVRHIDAGSRIVGFIAHVAAFRKIETLDIRPIPSDIPNVKFMQCDLMGEVPAELVESADSVSSLHAIEHFGLGRYGDPLDPDGHLKGFANLVKLLKPDGTLHFSAPFGKQCVHFNAHRVFSLDYLLKMFSNHGLEVLRFSYVDEAGNPHQDIRLDASLIAASCG